MTLARSSLVLLPALLACDGGKTSYPGTKMSDYFKAEAVTRSTYANEDQSAVPDNMILEKVEPVEVSEGRTTVTLEQRLQDASETFLGGVSWSTAPGDSTMITRWAGPDGVYVTFDPPIMVTDESGYMHVGDSVTTETGGTTYVSTFVGSEDCQVLWTPDPWEGCLHFTIDDGGGDVSANDPASRPIFVGDYYLVTRFFIALMHTSGYDAYWNLSDFDDPEDVQ